jgi:hypothetical protein
VRRADGTHVAAFTPDILGATMYATPATALRSDYLDIASRESGPGRVYARAVEQAGATWLTYWTWHAYNGFHFAYGGLHWGDWECVVIRVRGDTPELAAYAQHRRCEIRPWRRVHLERDRPVVIVARGSHAARFERGVLGNGMRAVDMPLELVSAETHPWLTWPGRWGQSRTGGRHADSPRGPAFKRQWNDPAGWVEAAAVAPA